MPRTKRYGKQGRHACGLAAIFLIALLPILAGCDSAPTPGSTQTPSSGSGSGPGPGGTSGVAPIRVVAAENFYGDLAKQIGGSLVSVTSILSDPNVDPHEYESNVQSGVAVTNAQIVIENGGGYDAWLDKLLSASPNPSRLLVTAYDIAPVKLPDNEHVFYSIDNMKVVAGAIADALRKLDQTDASTFTTNLQALDNALSQVSRKLDELKARFAGTPVGLTETIFLYQADLIGLNVLTPPDFEKAVAEGNDPPAVAVAATNDQITNKEIKVLIYNSQTVTPITDNLKNAAEERGIPLVPVTEMMPPDKNYQTWMLDQLSTLETALAASTTK